MDRNRIQSGLASQGSPIKALAGICLLMHLMGCSVVSLSNPWKTENAVSKITLITFPNANQNYSVAVDIVFIWDENLAVPLNELTAQQWFSRRQDYRNTYPNTIKVIHAEPMPGHTIEIGSFPNAHSKAERVIVFANYLNQQLAHRADITTIKDVRIMLRETTFTLESEDERAN